MATPEGEHTRDGQQTGNELASLVCKLRWLGMEYEADVLADQLAQQEKVDPATVAAQSCETD
jgi:hypothetical protein